VFKVENICSLKYRTRIYIIIMKLQDDGHSAKETTLKDATLNGYEFYVFNNMLDVQNLLLASKNTVLIVGVRASVSTVRNDRCNTLLNDCHCNK
jgi:hypothetical protein